VGSGWPSRWAGGLFSSDGRAPTPSGPGPHEAPVPARQRSHQEGTARGRPRFHGSGRFHAGDCVRTVSGRKRSLRNSLPKVARIRAGVPVGLGAVQPRRSQLYAWIRLLSGPRGVSRRERYSADPTYSLILPRAQGDAYQVVSGVGRPGNYLGKSRTRRVVAWEPVERVIERRGPWTIHAGMRSAYTAALSARHR